MNPKVIASHRAFFTVIVGLLEALQVTSISVIWSADPQRLSPFSNAAAIIGMFSLVGLFVVWWLLRTGAPRLASICLVSALVGIVCSMILPAT